MERDLVGCARFLDDLAVGWHDVADADLDDALDRGLGRGGVFDGVADDVAVDKLPGLLRDGLAVGAFLDGLDHASGQAVYLADFGLERHGGVDGLA